MTMILATNAAFLFLLVTALWLLSLRLGTVSFIDSFWPTGFALVAWATVLLSWPVSPHGLVIAGLVSLWALRLGPHLFRRFRHEGEDPRYASMRDKAGSGWPLRSYLIVFLLQGSIIWVVSIPLQAAIPATTQAGFADPLVLAGLVLFALGFLFEATADAQLTRFRKVAPAGAVLDKGLWAWSRHPNYFGNACLWWGLYLLAASMGAPWTIFAPLLMTFLLLRVSGVRLLEERLVETRPGYRAYQERTSAFIPWPPRT